MNLFKQAVKHEAKLRLAIAGPSGSGKTYTALAVGTALAGDGRIAVVDTEHGSASKYADLFSFDVLDLAPPFDPRRFVEAIQAAEQHGYSVVILDSVSHAWNGPGGVLEIVERASAKFKGNSYAGWQEGTPAHNALIEGIVSAGIHVIATMRSKQEHILVEDGRGRQVPQKVGMAPVQRDGFEYEFDVFLDMDIKNNAIVSKTRCPQLTGAVIPQPGADLAGILRQWLSGEPETDPMTAALEAANLGEWARQVYRLRSAREAFADPTAVEKWYQHIIGKRFDQRLNGDAIGSLERYANALADGVAKKEAIATAKAAFEAAVVGDEEE